MNEQEKAEEVLSAVNKVLKQKVHCELVGNCCLFRSGTHTVSVSQFSLLDLSTKFVAMAVITELINLRL